MNIQQHYQTCSDCKCPLFDIDELNCSALKAGSCRYQTIHMLQDTYNQYLDGERHGLHKDWYKAGKLFEECTYIDGKEHGKYKKWYENGQLAEEFNYVDGKAHGVFKWWQRSGCLWGESTYVNGKLQ